MNPSHPYQRVLSLPRSVNLKLPFKKILKSEFYPFDEGHNLYQDFKRKEKFEITHPYKFFNMLKFLCYKLQFIIQNIGNMINYNHSLTHVMHSLLSCTRWPEIIDDYEALAIEMWLWLPSNLGLQSKVWQCVNNYDYNKKEQLLVYY